jgi:hypothetical protein
MDPELLDSVHRKILTYILVIGCGLFLWKAAFQDADIMRYVVGFAAGTILTTVVNFVYGSSESSQAKDKMLMNGGTGGGNETES